MIPRIQASRSVWLTLSLVCLVSLAATGAAGQDKGLQADPAAISTLMRTLNGPEATELPMVYRNAGGFIQFLGAPPQAKFVVPEQTGKSISNPESAAREFMTAYGAAFGLVADTMELQTKRVVTGENGAFVRFDQYFSGLPVFGAQVIVNVDETLNVKNVNADILRDSRELDKNYESLTPVLTADQAVERAIAQNAAQSGQEASLYSSLATPELVIFDPQVLSMAGVPCVAWKVRLKVGADYPQSMTSIINAQTGGMLIRYADQAGARYREVYDSDGDEDLLNAALARKEGDPATDDPNIDTAYDLFGDCYNYYLDEHGRDSYDNQGSIIRAYVNYPMMNAFWDIQLHIMVIGDQFLSDDVLAHEFTHGVTATDSDLIYFSYAGAITEMFSDQGGEFVDLTNGRGDDSPGARWYIGEDLTFDYTDIRGDDTEDEEKRADGKAVPPGAIRYMKDPTVFFEPDRLGSPYLVNPYDPFYDLGGVHINCGVGNKLIYLLTDGDYFNGENVSAMGLSKVADLFYAARPMLSSTADYFDLFYALRAASVALNYSAADRMNIVAGARAVEIVPPGDDGESFLGLRDFRALPTFDTSGKSVVGLKWKNPSLTLDTSTEIPIQITLYRSVTDFPTGALDGLLLPVDRAEEAYLDANVAAGTTYYYTLIAQLGTLRQEAYAKATAGVDGMNVYTEVFGSDLYSGSNPVDLSYKQITFRPVLPPPPGEDDPYLSSMDFSDYEVTVADNVRELPVGGGGVSDLTYTDDGVVAIPLGDRVFPFFGKSYNQIYLSSNGYVLFVDLESLFDASTLTSTLDMPTLAAHFALPRISFLFTDLAPHIGGKVWAKELDDRLAITFESVAVKPPAYSYILNPNRITVQLELFDNGQIRITYQSAVISSGIVGLSDGRGVPEEPSTVYGDILDGFRWVDFSGLAPAPVRMSLNPVDTQIISAGQTISFNISAELPPSERNVPVYYAEWDGPGPVPFADNGDGTGSFNWETAFEDTGVYTVRVVAQLNGQRVFQDVRLVVDREFNVKPTARNLALSTATPGEDPTVDRTVALGSQLIAYFEYYHPYASEAPLMYGPGASILYWFRNGQVASAFTNSLIVTPGVIRPDDVWYFMIVPISQGGIQGDPVISPRVTVLGVPTVDEVFPDQGLTIGGDRITIRGTQLSSATQVTFDGVPGSSIRITSSTELTVVTPIHAAGLVTVAVETTGGIGRKVDAFTFVGDAEDPDAEKEINFFGCGPRNGAPVSLAYDLFPALLVALLLGGARLFRGRQNA